MRLLYLYKRVKLKGKNRTAREKRHNVLMRGIIRIRGHSFFGERSDTILSEFRPIFGLGAADLELEMRVQLTYFLFSRNGEKIKFGGIQVL